MDLPGTHHGRVRERDRRTSPAAPQTGRPGARLSWRLPHGVLRQPEATAPGLLAFYLFIFHFLFFHQIIERFTIRDLFSHGLSLETPGQASPASWLILLLTLKMFRYSEVIKKKVT